MDGADHKLKHSEETTLKHTAMEADEGDEEDENKSTNNIH